MTQSAPQNDLTTEDATDIDPAPTNSSTTAAAEQPEAGQPDTGSTEDGAEAEAKVARDPLAKLEREGDIAADFLEELLDIADLDGDIDLDVEGDRAMVAIVGENLESLAGRDGKVLDALQELTRLAVYQETGERSRLILDVAEYRSKRREQLTVLANSAIEKVKATGEPVALDPMTAFERKIVHDAVAAAGLTSESDGADPGRHVVISS
jgi:spoIIIJ-associated protein